LAGAARAHSVVFVLDRSLSMAFNGGLKCAQRELSSALRSLSPTTHFQVIAYNDQTEPLGPDGRAELLPATPEVVERMVLRLTSLKASSSTNHVQAVRRGLALRPELLILITDGVNLNPGDINELTHCNGGRSVIDVVEIGGEMGKSGQRLADLNGGVCKRVAPL
jgi:hypothetical protein